MVGDIIPFHLFEKMGVTTKAVVVAETAHKVTVDVYFNEVLAFSIATSTKVLKHD